MASSSQELELDLAELESVCAAAKRPRTRKVLGEAIDSIKAQLKVQQSPPPASLPQPSSSAAAATPTPPTSSSLPSIQFTPIKSFAWDSGEYNSSTVTVYVSLDGVGTVKDQVTCEFTSDAFDLKIMGLNGKNYRLLKDNLEKDIIPGESKFIVKKDRVTLKLKKVKGDYSYETWTNLTSSKTKTAKKSSKENPMGGIMDMMKDMYETGDDNMKKIIAESMMKAQRGEKSSDLDVPELPDLGGL